MVEVEYVASQDLQVGCQQEGSPRAQACGRVCVQACGLSSAVDSRLCACCWPPLGSWYLPSPLSTCILQPVNDTAAALESLAPGLGAADWMEAVRTLNLLRQLAAHHPGSCAQQL